MSATGFQQAAAISTSRLQVNAIDTIMVYDCRNLYCVYRVLTWNYDFNRVHEPELLRGGTSRQPRFATSRLRSSDSRRVSHFVVVLLSFSLNSSCRSVHDQYVWVLAQSAQAAASGDHEVEQLPTECASGDARRAVRSTQSLWKQKVLSYILFA